MLIVQIPFHRDSFKSLWPFKLSRLDWCVSSFWPFRHRINSQTPEISSRFKFVVDSSSDEASRHSLISTYAYFLKQSSAESPSFCDGLFLRCVGNFVALERCLAVNCTVSGAFRWKRVCSHKWCPVLRSKIEKSHWAEKTTTTRCGHYRSSNNAKCLWNELFISLVIYW